MLFTRNGMRDVVTTGIYVPVVLFKNGKAKKRLTAIKGKSVGTFLHNVEKGTRLSYVFERIA